MGWQYPFYSFAIVFVVMLIAIVGVPKCPPVKQIRDIKTGSGRCQGSCRISYAALS
jgi:hypothetical protein